MNAHNDTNSLSRVNYNLERLIDSTRGDTPLNNITYGKDELGILILKDEKKTFLAGSIIGFKILVLTGDLQLTIANKFITLPIGTMFSVEPLYDFNQKCWNKINVDIELGTVNGDETILTIYKPQKENE